MSGGLQASEPLYVTDSGVEIKEAYVILCGSTPNFCTVLGNPTSSTQEFRYDLFEVVDGNSQTVDFAGTKPVPSGHPTCLTANTGSFFRTGTSLAGSMAEGDEYFVYYNDELITSGKVTQR